MVVCIYCAEEVTVRLDANTELNFYLQCIHIYAAVFETQDKKQLYS